MTAERWSHAVQVVSEFLVSTLSLARTLELLAQIGCDAMPAASAASATLVDDRARIVSAAFTDEVASAMHRSQYDAGAGPCLTSVDEGRPVSIGDTVAAPERWSSFGSVAAGHGVRSTLSLPLRADRSVIGAVTFYGRVTEAFGAGDERDAARFAAQAAIALANVSAYRSALDAAQNLEAALHSRAVIEQAKGKLMEAMVCTADDAFAVLVRASQRENVKLRVIARRLVDGCGHPQANEAR